MDNKQIRKLQSINDFPGLLEYLRDELDWPIEDFEFDELTFYYTPEELGIDEHNAAKILEINRLRPLDDNQPWGIFFVSLEPRQLPVVALRRLLSKISLKKRASANKADQAAWHHDDILFISNFGEENERQLGFVHFALNEEKHDLPILKVLGWDNRDTKLHIDYVVEMLREKLVWPDDVADTDSWRKQWREAFTLRHKEKVNTSKEMAIRLAELARNIRDSILSVLEVESDKGPLRQIMETFKEALIHDLDEAGFADMYAQTIAYGLLSARIADPHGSHTVEHLGDHMRTNPFLRELMETFLDVGGRKRGRQKGAGLDFDELGVSEVVDLLDAANMEAVVRDFGDRNRQEDPVMHFYESFLHEYNKQLKVQRGVFYTPQPVVSYIVRSVHELLQTEFGLEDGLADTTTWSEMLRKHPDMKLPPLTDEPGEKRTISPDEPFVQILDPATGTATFLVEVIDVIYSTMAAKWKQQGKNAKAIDLLWNEYVPKHLLPRLHAYELMMAPYAIAHMKVGLKLAETGYRFEEDERARIYLTNALEPWQKQLRLPNSDALAHEAVAVNEIKRHKKFTVVVGNPPYSGHSVNASRDNKNQLTFIGELVEDYKKGCPELFKPAQAKWLQDDYVKFIRFSEHVLSSSVVCVLGLITNHSYLNNPTFRGMRRHLASTFDTLRLIDLHGNVKRSSGDMDAGKDENVFDIQQGVAIQVSCSNGFSEETKKIYYSELRGTRSSKYDRLNQTVELPIEWEAISPKEPLYLFVPRDESFLSEYEKGMRLPEIFSLGGDPAPGIVSTHDEFAYAVTRDEIIANVESLLATNSELEARKLFRLCSQNQWSYQNAKQHLANSDWRDRSLEVLYRPFDIRFTINDSNVAVHRRTRVLRHITGLSNLALCTNRQVNGVFKHIFCSKIMANDCALSTASKERTYILPLYLLPDVGILDFDEGQRPNLSEEFLSALSTSLKLKKTDPFGIPSGLTAEGIFCYAYAVLHSPDYRNRYKDFLKSDFPRLPLTDDLELFLALVKLGGELTALHLLESPTLKKPITKFIGKNPVVSKVGWTPEEGGTVWLDGKGTAKNFKPGTSGFRPVPEEVWNFHIGGYQVCEKWLKDRGPKKGNPGRTLTDEDIAHYHKIIIALTETIRIMAEIDEVIEAHGGWPGAFVTDSGDTQESESEVTYPDTEGNQAQLDMVAEPKDG